MKEGKFWGYVELVGFEEDGRDDIYKKVKEMCLRICKKLEDYEVEGEKENFHYSGSFSIIVQNSTSYDLDGKNRPLIRFWATPMPPIWEMIYELYCLRESTGINFDFLDAMTEEPFPVNRKINFRGRRLPPQRVY